MRIRDPGSGMETVRIRDPRWKKVGSGIRNKHPGSATLIVATLDLSGKNFIWLKQKGSATKKKILPKKPIFLGQKSFVAKTFLVHFLPGINLHSWNQYEKTDLLYLIHHIGTMNMVSTFKEQVLDFHRSFKILCHTTKLWNLASFAGESHQFVKITVAYSTTTFRALSWSL
jgi:hypothetical protein